MSDNRKSFTPRDMLTSGGNGDIGCATPFGYVTARYRGGEIVSVTVDEDRFVPCSGQSAEPQVIGHVYRDVYGKEGEAVPVLNSIGMTLADGAPLYSHPQPAQQSNQEDVIALLTNALANIRDTAASAKTLQSMAALALRAVKEGE